MVGPVRLALCGTLLAVCAPLALADTVTVTGNVSFTPDSLTFAPPFQTPAASGIFGGFQGGTVNYLLGTVDYTQGFPQTTEAFTITGANGDVLAFYATVNDPVKSTDASGNLDVTLNETGYYTFNGGPEETGYFDLSFDGTSPTGSTSLVQFTGTGGLIPAVTTAVTPEPNSLLLLGTGVLGCAGLLRRRLNASL